MSNPRIRLASLWRRWWLPVVLAAAGGALAAYLYGSRARPLYEAEAQVLVESRTGGAGQAAVLLPTYAEMVKSTPVLAAALRSTNSSASLQELQANVRGESDRDTRLISIRADDKNPKRAVALANGLAIGLKQYVSAAARSPSGSETNPRGQATIRVVEPATSAVRVRPRSLLLLEFGAMAGLFGAVAFALVAEARGARVSSEEDLAEVLPVLGSVNGAWPRLGVSFLDSTRASVEDLAAYRRLATRITVENEENAPGSLVVVGTRAADGSSAVGVKLALAFAQEGRRAVLVDFEGDLRRFLASGTRDRGARAVTRLKPLRHQGWTFDRFSLRSDPSVVVAVPRVPPRNLTQRDANELVGLFLAGADVLIVHVPPPGRSRVALTWARATWATVLVICADRTTRAEVEQASEGLETVGTKLVGTVLHRRS
jgi:polysaccharide biosynthesis transport protein